MWDTIGKVLTGVGGASFIIYKLSDYLGKRWAEKLNLKWKKEYDKELALFRDELNSKRELINTLILTNSSTYILSIPLRIDAFQKLWIEILRIKNLLSSRILLYDILMPEEFPNIFKDPKSESILPPETHHELIKMIALDNGIEEIRPLIGEIIWNHYFIYRALIGRISLKFCSMKEKRVMWNWNENEPGVVDNHIVTLMEKVFSKEQIEIIMQFPIGAPKVILDLIEQKILHYINNEISGTSATEFNFNQAIKYSEMLKEINTPTDE